MAFFTFTTISGSAATNDLVISVTNNSSVGAATLSIQNGYVAFTNSQGNTTVSDWTVSNFANGGIPSIVSGGAANVLNMTLATFQTTGLGAKLQGATAIDASGATADQIDAFISNHTGANAGSLQASSVDAAQFVSLKQASLLATASATVDGVVALDATDATAAQMAQIVAGVALINDEAISNAYVMSGDFGTLDSLLALDASNTLDASTTAASGSALLLAAVTTYADALAAVVNLSVDGTGVLALDATNSALIDKEIILASTTTSQQMDAVIEYRSCFAVGSITSATGATVAQVIEIPNKFAAGAVNNGAGATMSLATATAAQIAALAANSQILATGSATVGLTAADLSPSEFSLLAAKVKDNQATVDAAGATRGEVDTILANLTKFVNTTGLTNLEMTANQWASVVARAGVANLALATDNGEVTIIAEEAAMINATSYTKTLTILGSDGADYFQGSATASNTIQGAKGKDYIVGSSAADELRGGNAADTIIGGLEADTIYGGKSSTVQTLTGDAAAGAGAIDTFILAADSINNITDLGYGSAFDVVQNAAGAVTTATTAASWTASNTTSNAGTLTITAGATGQAINAALMTGTVGVTLNSLATGADSLTGSNFNDTLNGGDLDDSLVGGAGNDSINGGDSTTVNTVTGGTGTDTFHATSGGTNSITDLTTGDVVIVDALSTSTTTAASVTAFVATSATQNNAADQTHAVIHGGTAAYVDLSLATGTAGWTVDATSASATTLIGSSYADSITGGSGADALVGNAGNDTITGGSGTATITGGVGADSMIAATGATTFNYTSVATIAAQTGITLATADGITGFTSGTDFIKTGTAGTSSNYVEATAAANYAAALAAANVAFQTAGVVYYLTDSTADSTGLLFVNATSGDGSADAVIKLAGVTSASFVETNIIA